MSQPSFRAIKTSFNTGERSFRRILLRSVQISPRLAFGLVYALGSMSAAIAADADYDAALLGAPKIATPQKIATPHGPYLKTARERTASGITNTPDPYAPRIPTPTSPYLPELNPNWNGVYAGVNVGASWINSKSLNTDSSPLYPVNASAQLIDGLSTFASGQAGAHSPVGAMGGGQIGYNWEIINRALVSVETDFQGGGSQNSLGGAPAQADYTTTSPYGTSSNHIKSFLMSGKGMDYFGTLRARAGYLVQPYMLFYATAGLAYGNVKARTLLYQNVSGPDVDITGYGAGANTGTRVGWTVGGGMEWLLKNDWSVKIEYLYYDLGSSTWASTAQSGSLSPQTYLAMNSSTRFNGNLIRAGLNYHINFNPSTPLILATRY